MENDENRPVIQKKLGGKNIICMRCSLTEAVIEEKDGHQAGCGKEEVGTHGAKGRCEDAWPQKPTPPTFGYMCCGVSFDTLCYTYRPIGYWT